MIFLLGCVLHQAVELVTKSATQRAAELAQLMAEINRQADAWCA